jgi:putative acetyltransferase
MTIDLDIRETTAADIPAIAAFYPRAFPDEDLVPLVRELLREPDGVLSLTALLSDQVAGHVIFTICGLDSNPAVKVAVLGPLAVTPERHRQGIGAALIRDGVVRSGALGAETALVLGDPSYYGRFGFKAESGIKPPYHVADDQLPPEWRGAWQSMTIDGNDTPRTGTVMVPTPWQHRNMWLP